MTTQRLSAACLALLAPVLLSAAARGAPQSVAASAASDALLAWRADHGSSWRIAVDDQTGYAEMLYGGNAESTFLPRSAADWFVRARVALEETSELTGVDSASLSEREVIAIPLAHLGTTDKLTVSFTQRVAGYEVEGARVNVLFDSEARLLSVHSTALTGGALSVTPAALTAAQAVLQARELFAERHQLPATRSGAPELVVQQVQAANSRVARLAWRVEVFAEISGAQPVGETLWLDASSAVLVGAANLVHNFDVSGTVNAMATPGTAPDTSSNPEQSFPMRYLRLTSSQGDVETDVNGNFNFVGINGPLQVTASFEGDFARVWNDSGSEYSTSPTLQTGGGNSILMNSSTQGLVTAQANAFYHINLLRDWVRSINPADSHADFIATAHVNLNQSCNAYYNGNSVNFFTPGGSCVNTAYSTIVAHEMGHWLNVRYGTGNGADGMGEGNADVWAMYLYDNPIVGEGFSGGGYIRSGLNNLQFCGDFGVACHGGEVHQEGKVWMGAAWKIRDELNQSLGNSLGDDLSNALFLGWMASYNQTQIKSIIETQWIVLDDDDGDINNGSPHYTELEAGFAAQGWPGVELHPITIEDVSIPGDSLTESGPYDVELSMVPHMGQSLTSTQLHYRVNGGAWQDVDLAALPNDRFASLLPDVASPSAVELWFSAADSLGNSLSWPESGATAPASFVVGAPAAFVIDNFEGGPGSWTHGSYNDTSNTADEWEHGFSGGKSGDVFDGGSLAIHWSDPPAAASGFDLWSVDLGVGSDGRHGNDTHSWLRSPAYDCTGHIGTRLRFKRWATVHRADEISLRVNGALVWTSGDEGNLLDNSWTEVEYDISGHADGLASVVIEFEILSNQTNRLGGWQIDDLQLLEFGPVTQSCSAPIGYGAAKPSSTTETPYLLASGTPVPGGNFQIKVHDAALNQPAFLFSGPSWAMLPYGGAYRLVSGPIVREAASTTSAVGIASFPVDVSAGMLGGTRFYQVWFRDPAHTDGTGVGLSKGLRVDFCQ